MNATDTALAAIEQRVQTRITEELATLHSAVNDAILAAINAAINADDAPLSGTELLSRQDVNLALVTALAAAQTQVSQEVESGNHAAAILAALLIAAALRRDPQRSATISGFLPSILRDLVAAFGAALFDIHDGIRLAYDGVTGGPAARRQAARTMAATAALQASLRRLGKRAHAAGTVAVHRGFTDEQLAAYATLVAANPGIRVTKQWQTTSATPCPTCQSLNGTVVALDVQFPYGTVLPVYRDLHGPPRHVHCRCRLIFHTGK